MFTIWLIGVVVFGMYAGYRFGQAPDHVQDDIAFLLIAGVLFWPFALAFAIIIAPFAGAVYLGDRAKRKAENSK
jgi:hypothetical protein